MVSEMAEIPASTPPKVTAGASGFGVAAAGLSLALTPNGPSLGCDGSMLFLA